MIVLVSFERHMAVCKMKELKLKQTLTYMVYVGLFATIVNIPSMMIYEWNGVNHTNLTDIACNQTFIEIYIRYVLNLSLRFLIPIILMIVFNTIIYKKVKYLFF